MEDVKQLIPVKVDEDDKTIVLQTLVGSIGVVKREPSVFGASSSSSPIDMKDVKPLTLVKTEDEKTLVTQTQTGESSVKLEKADEPMVDVPIMYSNGFEDQKHVPLSNEDTQEKTSGGEEDNTPQQKERGTTEAADPVGNDTPRNATSSAATENNNTPLWFTLLAFDNQDTNEPLPQLPSRYLRVKNSHFPVSYVQKYIAKKLSLESEDEVELYLRNLPLDPSMLMCDLLRYWIATACPQIITTSVGSSAANHMLVLSYGRKPQPESP